MKYFVCYNDLSDSVTVREVRPTIPAPDAGFDEVDGVYYSTVEADSKEQAIRKALTMFLDVADVRVETCKVSFERVKNKFLEVAR